MRRKWLPSMGAAGTCLILWIMFINNYYKANKVNVKGDKIVMYKIGSKILMINGILFVIIGLYSVFFNNTSLFSIINWIMDPNFWDNNEVISKGTLDFKIFTWVFLGMLHIMWGVCVFYIAKYGLIKNKEAWAWRCICISVIAWLLIDVYFSLIVGRNTFLLVTIFLAMLFIVPLIMTKGALKK